MSSDVTMGQEVELKYAVGGFRDVRQALEASGAAWSGRAFEQNAVFDTPERSLLGRGMLLRLRRAGGRAVLCLKKPPETEEPPGVKVFEELESGIDEPDQLRDILLSLGFVEAFRYEKLREEWRLDGCLVCLDLLPFGRYVEIEGRREAIRESAGKLGLSQADATTKTYHQLNSEHRAEQGLPPDETFIFTDPERVRLIERGEGFC